MKLYMKSVIVIVLLLLLCLPAFAGERNKLTDMKDLDRRISNVMTGDQSTSIQREELRKIKRELEDLAGNDTDPDVRSLYFEINTRLKDLYPDIE